jgi:hypothetical protein
MLIGSLTVAAWLSGLLCLVGFLLICAIWFLVPTDPSLALRANAFTKLKPIGGIALLIFLFAGFSKVLFAVRDSKAQLD